MVTQKEVKELFDYNNGVLYWKNPWFKTRKDKPAGTRLNTGYRSICINYNKYLEHRLIYLYHHGVLPKYIDHVDGDPSNNLIENLRECSNMQNHFNEKKPKNNTSGIKGVSFHKATQKWRANVFLDYKQHYLGLFNDIQEAEKACKEFRNKHHGEFARHE